MEHEALSDGLESALLDQRMRAEKHKANFEALKAQHLILQDAHRSQQDELAVLAENYERLAARSQEIIHNLQTERDNKIIECEDLRAQVLTPAKLEQLKSQLLEESTRASKKRLESLEGELEAVSRECLGLKQSYSFLKSEYENTLSTHQTVLQELRAKHHTELNVYIEERKAFMARNGRDVPTDMQRIRQLQRNNNDLQQKVKGLLAENEELRGLKEETVATLEQSQQAHCQLTAELRAKVKTLELECSTGSDRVRSVQDELSKARGEVVSLSQQLALTHSQLDNHKRRLGELEHQHSLEISELKMKELESCRELEAQRDSRVAECRSLQAQLDAQAKIMEDKNTLLADKDRECETRVALAQKKEWGRLVELEQDKLELEGSLAQLQQQLTERRETEERQSDALEDRLRELGMAKSGLESEVKMLRGQLEDKSKELQTVMMEVKQVAGVSRKYQSLLSEHKKLEHVIEELRDSKLSVDEALRESECQSVREKEVNDREREQLKQSHNKDKMTWEGERDGLLGRLKDCEASKLVLEQQLTASKATNKKLQKHYKKAISELERNVEVLRAEQEIANTEKAALESSLGLENQRLQRKLSDILRKQKEFQFLLLNHPQSIAAAVQHSPEYLESTQDIDNLE